MSPLLIHFAIGLAVVAWMAWLGRLAGGGAGAQYLPKWAGGVPEILIGLSFGVKAYLLTGAIWYGAAASVASWLAWELGHGNGYHDGTEEFAWPDRFQTLDYLVRPLCQALTWVGKCFGQAWHLTPRSKWYCRVFMGTKGLLIGLAVSPAGLLLAIGFPIAYALSFRVLYKNVKPGDASAPAEWLTGAFAGAVLAWG